MNAIIIDDESFSADYLEMLCLQTKNLDIMDKFSNAYQALDYLSCHDVDIVFLDIEMPGLNGLEALRKMRQIKPELNAIFVTGYDNYALEAFQAEAVAYLLKPCSLSELERAVVRAAKLIPSHSRVTIQTFGRFRVFIDGEPYRFSNAKAKELLALLVDQKGGIVTMEQAVDVLWEAHTYDDAVKQLYRKAVINLNQLCRDKNLDFFVSNRGTCHILPAKLDCDYYHLLSGSKEAAKIFGGEYLLDYSWAENTLGTIQHFL